MLKKFTNVTGRQSTKTLDRYFTSHSVSLKFLFFRRLVIHDSFIIYQSYYRDRKVLAGTKPGDPRQNAHVFGSFLLHNHGQF
jgi:hypothetical protein